MPRMTIAVLAVLAAGAAPATAAAQASFAQLSGQDGCLLSAGFAEDDYGTPPPDGCAASHALLNPVRLVAAPDGGQLAVVGSGDDVSGTNGVTVLARDAASGALSFASCVTDDGGDGRVGSTGACTDGDALGGADGLAFSPDGKFAYVTAARADAVSWFARDPRTGELTQRGCAKRVIGLGDHCALVGGLDGAADVLVSRDGKKVYVAAALSGQVRVFDRDLDTGALTARSCVSATGSDGTCARATGLAEVDRLAMGPGGTDLYASSSRTGALVALSIDTSTGDLAATDCVVPDAPQQGPCHSAPLLAGGILSMVVAPDGRDVLLGTATTDVGDTPGGLIVFHRTGDRLAQSACLQNAQPQGDDAVDAYDRGTPDLSPGCDGAKALGRFGDGVDGVAVSADGRGVFAVSDGELAAFTRDPATGTLTQFGCAEAGLTYKSCGRARGLETADAIAATADARNVYVAGYGGDVAVFGASVAIASRALSAHAGRVRVRLACPRARRAGCAGRLSGSRYRLAAGRAGRVTVRLPARIRRALHRRRHTAMTLVAHDRLFGPLERRVIVRR